MNRIKSAIEDDIAGFLFSLLFIPTWILWWIPVSIINPRDKFGLVDTTEVLAISYLLHVATVIFFICHNKKMSDDWAKKSFEERKRVGR